MGEETYEERDNGLKKKKGDYGIRVARPGYDAGSCADSQLLFNSNWPIIQIAKVIDFDVDGIELVVYVKNIIDPETWETTFEPTYDKPDNLEEVYFEETTPEYRVGRKYCYKLVAIGYGMDSDGNYWEVDKYKVKQHQLGYIPMWYLSDWVSDVTGKVILTNIDLATDVEYPYTDAPSVIVTPIKDYGIKSSSVFPKVDGLDTGMFSKLVKRVMTTEKSGRIGRIDDKITSKELWWLVKDESVSKEEAEKLLREYELYGYSTGVGDVMCFTVEKSYTYHPLKAIMNDDDDIMNQYVIGATTVGQDLDDNDKVMVIARSPMVSPEYEEVIV